MSSSSWLWNVKNPFLPLCILCRDFVRGSKLPRACHWALKTMICVVIITNILRFWTKQTTKDSPLSHLLMLTPHGWHLSGDKFHHALLIAVHYRYVLINIFLLEIWFLLGGTMTAFALCIYNQKEKSDVCVYQLFKPPFPGIQVFVQGKCTSFGVT